MATTLSRANIGKPTPPFWHKVGKALVWLMPVISGSILVLPIPSLLIKGLLVVGSNLLLAIGKQLTSMTYDPTKVPLTYFPVKEIPEIPTTKDVTGVSPIDVTGMLKGTDQKIKSKEFDVTQKLKEQINKK